MVRSALLATALLASFCASSAQAQSFSGETPAQADNKLLIVDRDRGRVIYDDGRNDLFCATRQVFVGYNYYGRPLYRRTMRCR